MPEFDLVIRNGTVATASDVFASDVGIIGGQVAALGEASAPARGRSTPPAGWCCRAAWTATPISTSLAPARP